MEHGINAIDQTINPNEVGNPGLILFSGISMSAPHTPFSSREANVRTSQDGIFLYMLAYDF